MAADLHIHVFEPGTLTEDHFRAEFSNTIGSRWSLPLNDERATCGHPFQEWADPLRKEVVRTPNVWVGEVSWLKAALFDDIESYVPDTVGEISEIIGEELPVIDEELIERIEKAFSKENKTRYGLARKEDVAKFLIEHLGWQAFTISW